MPRLPPKDGFRRDIQGLRGIAVLLVVLFHADLGLPGGFVGVDVFFVISGFVIARMLLAELDATGRINFAEFYARRARRLLPALALLTIVVLSPTGAQQLAASTAMAASGFVANFHFVQSAGYFDPAERTNPFLHTWSLAVEEQFYLVLPITLFWSWRKWRALESGARRQRLVVAIGAAAAVSLAASWGWTSRQLPVPFVKDAARFAFYGPVSRVWEFAVGVLLALEAERSSRIDRRIAVVLGAAGIALVAWSALTFTAFTPFPGVPAAVPVAGAGLLVLAGGASALFARVLGWRPLAWIGDVSYGWYLWSWPAAVLTREVWPSSQTALMIAAAGSIVPAWLSYTFLEQPIRRSVRIIRWRALGLAAICIAAPVSVAMAVTVGAGYGWGLVLPKDVALLPLATRAGCDSPSEFHADQCTFRVPKPRGTILLLGDSHAQVIADAVTRAANAAGFDLAVWTRSGCPYLGRAGDYPGCKEWQAAATALAVSMKPDVVFIANYSTSRSTYVGKGSMVDARGEPIKTPEDAFIAWRDGLDSALQQLKASGSTVVLMHNVPEFATPGYRNISWLHPNGTANIISRQQMAERRRATVDVEQMLSRKYPYVALFDPAEYLCPDMCSTFRDRQWMYFDSAHLSLAGAAVLDKPLTTLFDTLLRLRASTRS